MPGLSEGLVYLDEHMVVLDKPAGLLAVPGRGAAGRDCLSARAQALWPDALVVHRLDMATSGLLLMARGPLMQRRLGRAFEERKIDKRYVAVVQGDLSGDVQVPLQDASRPEAWTSIDLPIGRDWNERPRRKIDLVSGQASLTRWRVLAPGGHGTTRVLLDPLTGRTHQLRVHLAAIGHPILGDALYAPPEVRSRAGRLMLHAASLTLPHPATGEAITFESRVPF